VREQTRRGWREELLERVLVVALPLATFGVAAALLMFHGRYRAWLLSLFPFLVALAVVTWKRDWPRAVRAGVLVATFVYATVVTCFLVGFHGNMAALGATCTVLTGLLFGRRPMLLVLGVLVVVPVVAGTGMVSGAIPLPDPTQAALTVPIAWVRTTVVAVVIWAMLGLAVTFVVERIESALGAEQAALEGLRAEQVKRERADAQRLEAERVAAQAQRFELAGQLAAGVAHDFNNILSVVQCWAELALRQSPTAENLAEGHDAILAATRQGSALAQQLLTFCRRNVRSVHEVELDRAVDGIMKMVRPALPDGVKLTIEHGERSVVRADETELNQVMVNLVVNARDAMQGKGRLRVATGVEAFEGERPVVGGTLGAGRWATITVEDSGPGIDPSSRSRIFEPFFTTKPAGVGTGLGLATVLGIARQSGGGVALESKPGEGARFTVYFPEHLASGLPSSRVVPAGKPRATGRSARVLLVEDTAPIRTLIASILEAAGHRVVATADCAGALEAIAQGGFDLLCTDAVMPGAPVRELLDAFETSHPHRPILVVSGHVDEELTRRGIEQGRYALLRKPFTPPELCAAVDELLEQADLARQAGVEVSRALAVDRR
jgi:signal transduction histidine kinase/CheY-like chemotaxis protein